MKKKRQTAEKPRRSPGRIARDNLYLLGLLWKASPQIVVFRFLIGLIDALLTFLSDVWLLRRIINGYQAGESLGSLLFLLLTLTGVKLVCFLPELAYTRLLDPILALRVREKLEKRIFRKGQEVELACYEDKTFFDKYLKASEELPKRVWGALDTVSQLLSFVLSISLNTLLVLTIDPWLLVFALLPVLVNFFLRKKRNAVQYEFDMKKQEEDRQRNYTKRTFYLADFAKEMRMTHIYRVMFQRFDRSVKNIIGYIRKYGFRLAALDYIIEESGEVLSQMGAMLFAVCRTFLSHTMLLGDCLVVVNSVEGLTYFFSSLISNLMGFHENSLYVDVIREFLDYQPKIRQGALDAPKEGELVLKNISFRYPGQESDVLRNVNLRIRPGEKIALVGHNGAGKSTLVKLLLRLYDPTEGEILYGGRNIKDYALTGEGGYRNRFGTVFQDFKLFSLSVLENVLLRKPREGDRERVIRALESSGAAEKISSLPNGIDSTLTREFDEQGVVLSGGEGQKVAIARAFAGDAEILILDEPSSALDPIAEYKMYESMLHLGKNRSVVFISHRLSSAVLADRIYLLENGRVIEEGSHRELLEKDGKYAEMFRVQAENYLEKEVCV